MANLTVNSARKIASQNLPRMLAMIARQYRAAGLDDADAKELFYIFTARDFGWDVDQDLSEFIVANRELGRVHTTSTISE